jgi:cell division protein FtsB
MSKIAGVILCIVMTAISSAVQAQGEYDFDKEIVSLRKELSAIASQRKMLKEEIIKDEKEFAAYVDRTKMRMGKLRSEVDSVKKAIEVQGSANDSLRAVIAALQNGKRQADLQQGEFREKCVIVCDDFIKSVRMLPPMIRKPFDASLSLLRSELISNGVENSEALQRLNQILRDIDDAATAIQFVQGVSPVPEIRGTAYRIRIGMLFEAVVNMDGTSYAVWNGYDSAGKELWSSGNDRDLAEQLLKCVNVREAKSLPDFVQLPVAGLGRQEEKQ